MQDRSGLPLSERLLQESRRYSFFQLVSLLLRERQGSVPPGRAGPASREAIRFRPAASLGFPGSDVESVEQLPDDVGAGPGRFLVTVNFMGLYGPASPLPSHVTEEIIWAGIDGAGARDFLDLFNHRLISFLYRSWEKYRYPVQFDPAGSDEFTLRVLCLLGLGTPGMFEEAGLPTPALLRTAGILGSRHRSAAGLEGLLRDHFPGVGVRVDSCVERRAVIPRAASFRLGRGAARLGEDACLGETVRDRSGGFRLTLGPMSREEFRDLLPGHPGLTRLLRLTRLYLPDALDFDLALRLRAPEVPALRLDPAADLPLGQMSWLAPRGEEEGRARVSIRGFDPLVHREPTRPAAPAGPETRSAAGTRAPAPPRSNPTRRT